MADNGLHDRDGDRGDHHRLSREMLTPANTFSYGSVYACLWPDRRHARATLVSPLAARLVQAIGTGIFIPVMMSTVLAIVPRMKMGTYLSIGGCMITFGPAFTPVASGIMVTTFGRRSIFLPPAALIVILMVLGIAFIRNITEPEPIKLDMFSIVLSVLGLFLFVYGLSLVMSDSVVAVITAALGLCAIALFVWRQHCIPNPLFDLSPMHNHFFLPVGLLVVVAMMTTFSMRVLLPLYFEGALGTTAFIAGALLLVPILVNAVTSLVGGRMMDKKGSWPLLFIGFATRTIGQLGVCLFAPQLSLAGVLVASIVVYAGVGLVLSPSQTAGLQTLRPEESPHGVANLNTFIQVAASLGPSLFIGVLSSVSGSAEAAGTLAMMAQAEGFASAVAVATAIAAIGAVTAFIYGRKRQQLANAKKASLRAASLSSESTIASKDAVALQPEILVPADVSALCAVDLMKAPYVVNAEDSVREVVAQLIERKTSACPW